VAGRRDWTRETLAAGVLSGDRRALARAITLVENGDPLAYEVVADLYPQTGNAYAVGFTGPPGVGKSTLISALVRHVRARDAQVGVVSVDPSSPFSHGALLGDRIRLSDHFLDPGVFIRSMGTRGHLQPRRIRGDGNVPGLHEELAGKKLPRRPPTRARSSAARHVDESHGWQW